MHINQFKQGDIITRVEPCSEIKDRSYIGDKLLFVEIVNGTIRCMQMTKNDTFKGRIIDVPLCDWSEGWEKFQTPIKIKVIVIS